MQLRTVYEEVDDRLKIEKMVVMRGTPVLMVRDGMVAVRRGS